MNFWLLNTFKFLAYIAPFLFGFSLITISAMNGTFLQPIIYFGILALTMMLLSQIKLNKDIPLPADFNEICKTWGWNFFDDAYYRPSLGTYFIVFSVFYTLMPMIINKTFNIFFLVYIISVFVLDTVFNFSINKCYTTSSCVISIFAGTLIGNFIFINKCN